MGEKEIDIRHSECRKTTWDDLSDLDKNLFLETL